MRKLIFAINVTIDGFADHTAMIADDELHLFFADLLERTDTVLFGRKTYQLMESYWPRAADDPASTEGMKKYAEKINNIQKIVFSHTLDKTGWNNTRLYKGNMTEEVIRLKNLPGKSISAGSLSLAAELTKQRLIDEYWFLVHPIILGKGLPLFRDISTRADLKLLDTRIFKSGVVVLHYKKQNQ